MAKKNNGRDFLFSDDCGFINGDYRLDAEVVITYHTLKKNKPK